MLWLSWDNYPPNTLQTIQTPNSRRKHDVSCILTQDVVGLGLPSDNNFQPTTSFVSLAMLGTKIVVGVTFLRYGGFKSYTISKYPRWQMAAILDLYFYQKIPFSLILTGYSVCALNMT